MAFCKVFLLLAALVACAMAAEETREKKAIYGLATGYYQDDGSWWPAKYDSKILPVTTYAAAGAYPYAYNYGAYPYAYNYGAYPYAAGYLGARIL